MEDRISFFPDGPLPHEMRRWGTRKTIGPRVPQGNNPPPGGAGGGGVPGGGGQDPDAPPTIDERIQAFEDFLAGNTIPGLEGDIASIEGFRGEIDPLRQQTQQGFDALQQQFQGIVAGNDPRFDAFRQGQFGLLNRQRGQNLEQTRGALARQGIGGSVALNEANRINEGFDTQQRALSGQIGLQQLGRQDQFLTGQQGLLTGNAGIQSGLLGQQADFTQLAAEGRLGIAGLQALTPGFAIQQLAAENAGESGGGKDGIFK